MNIRPLDDADRGYALASMRESHKQSPGCDRIPWNYYKATWGALLSKLINDPVTVLWGAYDESNEQKLVGYLIMTPGKRTQVLHWVQVKYELDGVRMRRRGVMEALLDRAQLGTRFVYTLKARRDAKPLPDGSMSKSFDETLAAALRARGQTPAYVSLKEYLK